MTALDEIHNQSAATATATSMCDNSNSSAGGVGGASATTNTQQSTQSSATLNSSTTTSPCVELLGNDTNVVFPTGSIVECHTALSTQIVGQVLSYDHPTRLLLIKDTSSGPKPVLRLLNLALVEKVTCVGERNADCVPYTSGSSTQQQIHERIRKAEARKQASLLQADVSLEGQRIFLYLRRTLDEVRWQDANIVVLNRVLVRPPYTPDSVQMLNDTLNSAHQHAKDHVCKILSKYHSVRQVPPPAPSAAATAAGAPPSSTTHHNSTSPPTDDAPADPSPSSH